MRSVNQYFPYLSGAVVFIFVSADLPVGSRIVPFESTRAKDHRAPKSLD
jgi:hypothetical protein